MHRLLRVQRVARRTMRLLCGSLRCVGMRQRLRLSLLQLRFGLSLLRLSLLQLRFDLSLLPLCRLRLLRSLQLLGLLSVLGHLMGHLRLWLSVRLGLRLRPRLSVWLGLGLRLKLSLLLGLGLWSGLPHMLL
jgi:hypothetical protein